MHPEALSFVGLARARLDDLGVPMRRVVEFGSYDVNGSARPIFSEAQWLGIDQRAGRGVDVVTDCRDWNGEESYDLVVTTEMLEHCPEPWRALDAAWKALRPGGFLIATMAAPERLPHDGNGDPLDQSKPDAEYYAGISSADCAGWLSVGWNVVVFQHDRNAGDLRCVAQKVIGKPMRYQVHAQGVH